MVKLVLLYVVALTVTEPIDNMEDLLYSLPCCMYAPRYSSIRELWEIKGRSGSRISRDYKKLRASIAIKMAMSGSWLSKLTIVLPWQVATAEILLERNQTPNRSGKSLVSRAFGSQFLFGFIPGLYFFSCSWSISCWVVSSVPKVLCITMSTFAANWRGKWLTI